MSKFPQLIVCACLRHKVSGEQVCGPRHGDCLNALIRYELDLNPGDLWEFGFADQDNNFLTRKQAWKVADAAGQIRRPTGLERDYNNPRPPNAGDEGLLFSENLY